MMKSFKSNAGRSSKTYNGEGSSNYAGNRLTAPGRERILNYL
jgi:hypothetical protein